MPIAGQPNARWSLDFVSDSFGTSRKFRDYPEFCALTW